MLSDNIKTIRKNRGFTQEELAARLHVTRQTISKWEKGHSVPDADLLSRMAEVLEVPVTELLGAPSTPPSDPDPIVEQLSRINEQLAIKNRRAATVWKIVAITLAALILLPILAGVLFSARIGGSDTAGTTEWACVLDGGETHFFSVSYDSKYRVVAGVEDTFFEENGLGLNMFRDVRKIEPALRAWFEARGGTVEVYSQSGLPLE